MLEFEKIVGCETPDGLISEETKELAVYGLARRVKELTDCILRPEPSYAGLVDSTQRIKRIIYIDKCRRALAGLQNGEPVEPGIIFEFADDELDHRNSDRLDLS